LADDHHVLVLLHEDAGREVDDLRLGHRRVEVEVEVFQGLHLVEARAAQPTEQLLLVSALDFVMEDAVEELGMREVVTDGLLRAQVHGRQHSGQAQLLEDGDQLVGRGHGASRSRREAGSVARARSAAW